MIVLSEPWTLSRHQEAVMSLSFGKRLPRALYVLDGEGFQIPADLGSIVGTLRQQLAIGAEFNVLKFATDRLKISFLSYPDFFSDPHPTLAISLTVDLATGTLQRTDYRGRSNPPILHRKEAFLPDGHPAAEGFRALTAAEEAEGLYAETSLIGFRLNWEKLLAFKGLGYDGQTLVRVRDRPKPVDNGRAPGGVRIERHKTAISRSELSKPVKALLDYGLLEKTHRFLDYGCGLGDDVRGLAELGYQVTGWDPYYRPDAATTEADIVNLGFVVNVIEDPAERVETVQRAWNCTGKLLVVSTLMTGRECHYSQVQPYSDGLLTNRNTFQKHYEPSEFRSFVEDALGAEVVPIAPDVCFVFRRLEDQQDFVARRSKRSIDWEQISQRLRFLQARTPRLSLYERHRDLLDDYWHTMLEFGRPSRSDEYERYAEIRSACGSGGKAAQLFVQKYGDEPLEEARERRKEDLLVYLSGGEFQKRRAGFNRLSPRLRADVKGFFGNYAAACNEARELLFTAGDPGELELAVEDLDFGWLDSGEGHFTIHSSLLDRLPPLLRIYVECGARLFGDPRQADLIKLHLCSKKLTFLHYEDFSLPLPVLDTRIKIDLRRLFVNVIDHTTGPEHQILFFKERFLAPDHPELPKFQAFSKRLRKLGIHEGLLGSNDRFSPSKEAFEAALARADLTRGLSKRSSGSETAPHQRNPDPKRFKTGVRTPVGGERGKYRARSPEDGGMNGQGDNRKRFARGLTSRPGMRYCLRTSLPFASAAGRRAAPTGAAFAFAGSMGRYGREVAN